MRSLPRILRKKLPKQKKALVSRDFSLHVLRQAAGDEREPMIFNWRGSTTWARVKFQPLSDFDQFRERCASSL